MTTALDIEEFARSDPSFYYRAFDRHISQRVSLNHKVISPYQARNDVVDLLIPGDVGSGYTCVNTGGCQSERVCQLIDEERIRLEKLARKIVRINVDFTSAHERILFEWTGEER